VKKRPSRWEATAPGFVFLGTLLHRLDLEFFAVTLMTQGISSSSLIMRMGWRRTPGAIQDDCQDARTIGRSGLLRDRRCLPAKINMPEKAPVHRGTINFCSRFVRLSIMARPAAP